MKTCKNCGSNTFVLKVMKGIIATSNPQNPLGFDIIQEGKKFEVVEIVKCQTCNTENPEIVEGINCPSCGVIVSSEEIQENNGMCMVCKARNESPELFQMDVMALARQLLLAKAENLKLKHLSSVEAHPVSKQAVTNAPVHASTAQNQNAPLSVPEDVLMAEEPMSDEERNEKINSLLEDYNKTVAEDISEYTAQKMGGYNRRLHNIVQALKDLDYHIEITQEKAAVIDNPPVEQEEHYEISNSQSPTNDEDTSFSDGFGGLPGFPSFDDDGDNGPF